MKYRTILADPPWPYSQPFFVGSATGRSANSTRDAFAVTPPIVKRKRKPYSSMSIEDICALPVGSLAEPDGCRLFLWTTNVFLRDAFIVIDSWGFKFRQVLVWDKRGGIPWPARPTSIAPNSSEFLLVGTVGSPKRLAYLPSSIISAGVPKQDSRKPEVFIDYVEQVSSSPYIELFARRHRLGWDVWGDESANTAHLVSGG